MADNSLLIRHLASRARLLHDSAGISQSQMANAIGMAEGNYSNFLAGKRGISAGATCVLLKYTSMPTAQAIAAFSKPVRSSRIMELQEKGRRMHLDDDREGWVPGRTSDPNDLDNSIADPDDDTLDSLRRARAIHIKAIGAIDAYLVKAKANVNGTTPINSDQRFSTRRY
jgi:transcriptional regulator with XRE-family HTH domain